MTEATFSEFITTRRRDLELTLGDVASTVGVSPITVSNWSNGQSTPEEQNLVALAEALKVPADELADMAGVELDSPPEPEPGEEVVLETVEPEDEAGDGSGDSGSHPVGLPSVEHMAEAGAEAVAGQADADDVVVEAVDPGEPEEATEAVTTPVEAAPAAISGPDVIPRVTAAPPTPTQQTPLTYVQDPKQLLRYRIRWGITTVALIIMAFVLVWALAGLIDSLSDVKESVTP